MAGYTFLGIPSPRPATMSASGTIPDAHNLLDFCIMIARICAIIIHFTLTKSKNFPFHNIFEYKFGDY